MSSVVNTQDLVLALQPLSIINQQALSGAVIEGFSLDSRTLKKGECFIALKGPNFDGNDFIAEAVQRGASMVVASRQVPGISIPLVIVYDTMAALRAVAATVRKGKKTAVIGITGSVGKTTTKEMLYRILREKKSVVYSEANENNYIGVSKALFKIASLPEPDICIAEMGSSKYGEIAGLAAMASPDIGVITDVGPSHLEGFYRLERVVEEKQSILRSPRTIGVINFDNRLLNESTYPNKLLKFGTRRLCDVYARHLYSDNAASYFRVNDKYPLCLKTPAHFNIYNALAAIGAGLLFGFSVKEATGVLSDFEFPAQRMQAVQKEQYYFINDAYNANPLSFISGLRTVQKLDYPVKIAIFGDMLELGENTLRYHRQVIQEAVKTGFRYLFLIGEQMHRVGKELLKDEQLTGKIYFFGDDYRIVAEALRLVAREGTLVYLKGSHAFRLEKVLDYFSEST